MFKQLLKPNQVKNTLIVWSTIVEGPSQNAVLEESPFELIDFFFLIGLQYNILLVSTFCSKIVFLFK